MRRWALSDLALDRPVTVGMALCAVLLLGVIGLFSMPLSFLPSDTKPRLYVRVQIERTSPEILEREVIRPIEEQVATVRDLERIQVGSGYWGVKVNLDFEPDIDARKLELRDRIERIRGELPSFVNNIYIGAYTNFDDPMMEMQVSSGTDLSEDYYLIEEHIVRKLERVPGVARVELDGISPHGRHPAQPVQVPLADPSRRWSTMRRHVVRPRRAVGGDDEAGRVLAFAGVRRRRTARAPGHA